MLITLIIFLIILSVLVLIHELGHFLVAKRFGIKVEEFGFGFPPRVWGIKRGETLYSINALPIGGFVKLYGEDEAGMGKITTKNKQATKDLDRAFFTKPIWQRTLVVTAGVIMNFLLAVVIISYLFTFQGLPTGGTSVTISDVLNGSPAQKAGIQSGDKVISINDKAISSTESLISQTKANAGKEITFKVERANQEKVIKLTPRINYPSDQGPLGIAVNQNIVLQKHPFPQSIFYGFKQAVNDSWLTVVGFKDLLVNIITRATVPQGVAGPIGMYQLTGEVIQVGPNAVLTLIYMLSISLAVLNILPIPALDGGRLFFIIIEAVTRRKVSQKYEAYAHMIGFILLIGFIAFLSYKDILRLISGQSVIPQ